MSHDWIWDAATDEDRAIPRGAIDDCGAGVMGRKSFDKNEGDGGWGDGGPVSAAWIPRCVSRTAR
ncbi:MAG: hypothetical protein M3070_04590, partial [Actinomycetota bacterium]|nr:hypothetical protein [Actinomycetota bacterium]